MAYVIWRVLMKKYSRIRLGIHRNPPVNPAETSVEINQGKYEEKETPFSDMCLPTAEAPSPAPGVTAAIPASTNPEDKPRDTSADLGSGLGGKQTTRRSSKAKRVKSYLKKCKDAALGASSSCHDDADLETRASTDRADKSTSSEPLQVENCSVEKFGTVKTRSSKRRSWSKEKSCTSWYVEGGSSSTKLKVDPPPPPPTDPPPKTDPPRDEDRLVSVIEIVSSNREQPNNVSVVSVGDVRVEGCVEGPKDEPMLEEFGAKALDADAERPGRNGESDVIDSRTEGGTLTVIVLGSRGEGPVFENEVEGRMVEESSEDATLLVLDATNNTEPPFGKPERSTSPSHPELLLHEKHKLSDNPVGPVHCELLSCDVATKADSCAGPSHSELAPCEGNISSDGHSDHLYHELPPCEDESVGLSHHELSSCEEESLSKSRVGSSHHELPPCDVATLVDRRMGPLYPELPPCDVATLVDRRMGPLYPEYPRVRSVLVRQARDLLVCTYHGNLTRFDEEFCRPAAELVRAVSSPEQVGHEVALRGWPLALYGKGVCLHLGELDPSLLRNRDCYLCVRTGSGDTPRPEVALVWQVDCSPGSVALPPTSLRSPLAMEEEAASSLSTLLQTLLLSVERAIERVPLDELSFPCPDCQEVLMTSCACACQVLPLVVEKRDSSIQTSPMFEYAGSIPHIDSDEESVASHEDKGTYRRLQGNKSEASTMTTLAPQREEPVLIPPGSIRELTEKVLMCGIHLPGIHDCEGRAVVVLDTTSLTRVCLEPHQVASLLLYYNTLPRPERLKDGLTLLVVSGAAEHSTLSLLDKALLLVVKQMKVGSVLIWRRPDCSYKGNTRLETSKIRCQVIKDETNLRQLLPEDQLPTSCGGRTSHDQIEWVEFYKELEPLLSASHACGRRLAAAMADLRATEGAPTRRQLHHQHRALARALADPELHRLRREGIGALGRLQERAHWLPASEDVRLGTERARQVFTEVDRAARRLEQLSEGRREKLRELARVRALEDESTQVLSWLSKKGEETLQRHAQLATNLPAIKEQEQDFEKFYFISMRHLDKGGDLLEECSGSGETPRASTPGSGGSGLRELARSLKHHLRGFSDRLEDTRERLEDTSRCFYLLDKAYEWSLETMKYMSRVKVDDSATTDQTLQMLKQLQQYLMAHPSISEEHFTEMWQLARKLGNEKLLEQSKVAHSRCQETMELIRSQQSRLNRPQDCDSLDHSCPTRPTSPRPAHQAPWEGPASSTPVQSGGRRRSVGSHPYIYKCSHHAAGHTCSCWEPPSPAPEEDCACPARPTNLGDIREVRESAEDLLEADGEVAVKSVGDGLCTRCSGSQTSDSGNSSSGGAPVGKRHLQRSCTWQFPTENFDDDDGAPCNGRLCGEEGHKCGYSTDNSNSGDNTTEGSEGCPKSAEDLEDQEAVCGNKVVPPVPVNSHLHCHPSTLDLSGSKEIKTQKTLLLIMREMIQTERDYVKSLDYIIENYIPELLREDIPQAMRGQRNVIFGNVEKIFEFHNQYFLQELEQCETSPLQVGQCFLRHEKKFYLYALYNKNKPKSDSLMSEYGTMFFKSKQIELGDKMDLASYLLKPVQRMGKYALLLQQLMKACRDKEGDVSELRSAEEMVRFQLRHGNDLLAMDSLRDCDVNVKEQGRLMRQNEFLVWQGKGKKCLRHVFLFEELILFSKARRFPDRKNLDLYIYKNSIKMTDIGLTAKIGDSPTKFEIWFRKRKPNDTFTLQSMSEEIKRVWTEELSKLLWKQALRNREMRLAEMSSMGIGNKPCLDIRPSADQISDRSISIAQLSKTAPRFRNSITVAPGELLRTNKRPHSIISVSSSSSSGASHSSGSGYGALINLGFDPADSPRLHHRSTTLQSQGSVESGIIADMSLGSEDTDGSGPHWHVERSNSSVTSMSLDSSLSPTSPVSPLEEDKGDLGGVKATDVTEDYLQGEEMSVKL